MNSRGAVPGVGAAPTEEGEEGQRPSGSHVSQALHLGHAVGVAGVGDVLLEGVDELVDRAVLGPALLASVHDVDGLQVRGVGPQPADNVLVVLLNDHVLVSLQHGYSDLF